MTFVRSAAIVGDSDRMGRCSNRSRRFATKDAGTDVWPRCVPPVFVVMCNAAEAVKASYRRFVANQIRKAFPFDAVPVIVHFRGRAA